MERAMAKRPSSAKIPVAIAWYAPEQWERIKQVVADPQNFEESHAEWEVSFQRGMHYLSDLGYDVHKVPVDVDELLAWCAAEGRPVDGDARSAFAADKLRHKFQARP